MSALIGKGRKPKFELHLKIYDLNNVPLVSGSSFIKWHLPHSMNAEHRGRTAKCPIANHRVEYSFHKVIPAIRMSIDRNNNLSECIIEFEILQEFPPAEKITLGHIKLNLAEYVEESETFIKDVNSPPQSRRRNNSVGVSPTSTTAPTILDDLGRDPEDGIVRRYLMQDSKVNSTLKISILLVQLDGERNFIAPPLKTAPVFGGIAAFMAPEQIEDDTGPLPNLSKNRDVSEIQDLYRRTLAASWTRQPCELPADECIEDIFSGGNGWRTRSNGNSATADTDDDDDDDELDDGDGPYGGTLRPSDFRRMAQRSHRRNLSSNSRHTSHSHSSHAQNHPHHHHHHHHHHRTHSGSSDKSVSTITTTNGHHHRSPYKKGVRILHEDGREWLSRDDDVASTRSAGSLASLAPTTGSSERERADLGLMKRAREVSEFEVRDDLVAWKLPGGLAA